ncbi:All-trans-nonaprenyl-diphosphate synthase (geranyl-diphosphate specific) [Polystyrenella longa]|uniref:All-trans-nonaprenyl-diphosphate synthase (Geranyl-diphosphate specific) n=1 Tax=Polystyrenella longa TaxID=2528007 RepID=A0A518CRL2_9PLAN|nr:polyprenyl synthetase family protein [Polystyrenella longa]QDU81850.1 All-trans-nonaprenyl-diphosphate synthase (geranyl-diphosphate specific) [Polystyrenella longa]
MAMVSDWEHLVSIAPSDPRAKEMNRLSEKDDLDKPVKRKKRRSTSHLKMVPETLELREAVKAAAEKYVEPLDKSRPFLKGELEHHSRTLLEQMELPQKFLGFAMVLIGNFFWRRQFLAVPFERRLLLLPHCLKHAEGCPAEYDEFGLDCETCGACSIADYKVKAEKLGYKVLVAEGSPVVLKIIIAGYVDGILGVACLNVLEKAIDKVLIAGVPSYAVPLHSGDCKNTKLDEAWIWEVLEQYEPLPEPTTASYLPLMRSANDLFEDRFEEYLPRQRSGNDKSGPLAFTETEAYQFLQHGGKRFRPFVTLAAYYALHPEASEQMLVTNTEKWEIPISVGRVAMAIEAFHKASLVHDDIQDEDQYRYGNDTLHRQYGIGQAINIGDYLIGLGYRLLALGRDELDAAIVADIQGKMAEAHLKLSDGQGAEMAWSSGDASALTPIEALQIYALKTSPAFEAALYAGVRMAGAIEQYAELISNYCRQVGVGFQILNDLNDWRGDGHNKLVAGQDAAALRPTVLLALALQEAKGDQKSHLEAALDPKANPEVRVKTLQRLYRELGVFEKAEKLVERSRWRAQDLADEVKSDDFRQLLHFLVETILEDSAEDKSEPEPQSEVMVSLNVTSSN